MKTVPRTQVGQSSLQAANAEVEPAAEPQHQTPPSSVPVPAQGQQAQDVLAASLPITTPTAPPAIIAMVDALFDEDITQPDSPAALKKPVNEIRSAAPRIQDVGLKLQEWAGDRSEGGQDWHLALALVQLAHSQSEKTLPSDVAWGPAIEAGFVDRAGHLIDGVAEQIKSCARPFGNDDLRFH